MKPSSLANPADSAVLGVYNGFPSPPVRTNILHSEGVCAEWRMVEVFGENGPFNCFLTWSGGGGSNQAASLTVALGSRVCIYARSLKVEAENLSSSSQRVSVRVGDLTSAVDTHNCWEVPNTGTGATQIIAVPRWTTGFRVETISAADLAAALIEVLDATGNPVAAYLGNAQVQPFNAVGGAQSLRITMGNNLRYRVIFDLSL